MSRQTILLTGARSLFTLDLARSFQAAGHRVLAAETNHFHTLRYSSSIERHFIIPSPKQSPEGFAQAIGRIIDQEGVNQVIPAFEEIFYLSHCLHGVPEHCHLFWSEDSLLHKLHHKWHFNQMIEKAGQLAPRSILMEEPEALRSLPFDYILKPVYSRAAQSIYFLKAGQLPPDVEVTPTRPWIAQEWICGERLCSYSVAHHGVMTAHTAYPVDYTVDGSSCLNFFSLNDPQVKEWTASFIEHYQIHGHVAFDFIRNEKGEIYPIECNPRGTSGIHLFKGEKDFANAFLDPQSPLIQPQAGKKRQIFFAMIIYFRKNRGWRRYLKTLFSSSDVIFSFRDLRPFFFQGILFFNYIYRALKMKMKMSDMFIYDIQWDGETLKQEESSMRI